MTSDQLHIALKEWDVVSRALREGRQIVLLRKGGILEAKGGFQIQHSRFALFPTFLHQNVEMVKPESRPGLVAHTSEPATITIDTAVEVIDVVQLRSRDQMDAIDDQHIWTSPLIDVRFNYRPDNPLYLLVIRAYRLVKPVTIENTPAYAGCKSWVPLKHPIDVGGVTPTIRDGDFDKLRRHLLARLRKPGTTFAQAISARNGVSRGVVHF